MATKKKASRAKAGKKSRGKGKGKGKNIQTTTIKLGDVLIVQRDTHLPKLKPVS